MLASRITLEQNHDHSYLKVLEILQFIESALSKIHWAHEPAANRTHGSFIGLQRLVESFRKTSSDAELVASLKQLVKPRNRFAHTYRLEHFFAQLNGLSDYELFDKTVYLMELHAKAEGLLTKVLRTLRSIENSHAKNRHMR